MACSKELRSRIWVHMQFEILYLKSGNLSDLFDTTARWVTGIRLTPGSNSYQGLIILTKGLCGLSQLLQINSGLVPSDKSWRLHSYLIFFHFYPCILLSPFCYINLAVNLLTWSDLISEIHLVFHVVTVVVVVVVAAAAVIIKHQAVKTSGRVELCLHSSWSRH
jgi:hypothetical protein